MLVSSLELCKELYRLSGWKDTYHYYDADEFVDTKFHAELMSKNQNCPAYELGYLLQKLPVGTEVRKVLNGYSADPPLKYRTRGISEVYGTPEDAACKLAIELFKQGVLK